VDRKAARSCAVQLAARCLAQSAVQLVEMPERVLLLAQVLVRPLVCCVKVVRTGSKTKRNNKQMRIMPGVGTNISVLLVPVCKDVATR